ncbi:MAG: glutamyl-tRNA reductase [Pseudomonadota bacterium]
MTLVAFGLNHKTAPVAIRERVAFPAEGLDEALADLRANVGVDEAAILSTCNRTEIYCGGETPNERDLVTWFSRYHDLDPDEVAPYIYIHPEQAAVRQVMRVASGLDSLVLGEPQILGQLKSAYEAASAAGAVGGQLNRLFQHTFAAAKQVRTDTAIGASAVSVAYAAVNLARQFFERLDQHTALLLGAGETNELVARHLREAGIGRIVVANRTIERAHDLARPLDGYAIELTELDAHLAEADLLVAATACPDPLVNKAMAKKAVKKRRHKPMLMVDIAVPRDIDPAVDTLEDVYLYAVDDLQAIIDEGLESRQSAAVQAEEIIDTQVTRFMSWLRAQGAVGTIRDFRENARVTTETELDKARRQLAAGHDADEIMSALAHRLTNKFLHTPTVQMNQAAQRGDEEVLRAARHLFDIPDSRKP